jgi:tetratricopeptide (TPR) repeat protein
MSVYDMMQKGIKCFDNKNFLESIPFFNKVLDRDSGNIEALLYKSDAFLKIKDYDESERCIDIILKDADWDDGDEERNRVISSLFETKANILLQKKEYSKALECIEEIEYHYPDSIQALLTKSVIQIEQGSPEKSLITLGHIEKISGDSVDVSVLVNKATALAQLDRYEEAIEYAEKAQKITPTAAGFVTIGNITGWLKRYEESIEYFKKSLEIDPKGDAAFVGIGTSLYFLNRLDESLVAINRAIELVPDSPYAYATKGDIYKKLNRLEKSLEYNEKVLEKSPKKSSQHTLAKFNKYSLLEELGRHDESGKVRQQIIEENNLIQDVFDENFQKENIQFSEQKHPSQFVTEVETGLRKMIETKMSQYEEWEKQRIPKIILEDALKRKKNEEDHPMFVNGKKRLIEYLNFGDYIQIFSYGKNWEKIFSTVFKDRDKCFGNLKQLIELRNAIHHNRELDEMSYGHLIILHQYFMFYLKNL